jgi:hypothetical protein
MTDYTITDADILNLAKNNAGLCNPAAVTMECERLKTLYLNCVVDDILPRDLDPLLFLFARARIQAEEQIETLNRAIQKQMRRATDAEYMAEAYRRMLGPKGRQVAQMWEDQHVTRIHTDFGRGAAVMSGEDIASMYLDLETCEKTPMTFKDGSFVEVEDAGSVSTDVQSLLKD